MKNAKMMLMLVAMLVLVCGSLAQATPVTSGLVLWLDAQDGSTLYQDSAMTTLIDADGQALQAWADKGPNGNHHKYGGGYGGTPLPALYTASGIGGNASFTFRQGQYYDMSGATGLPEISSGEDRTVFIVMNSTGTGATENVMGRYDTGQQYLNVAGEKLDMRDDTVHAYSAADTVPNNSNLILVVQGGSGHANAWIKNGTVMSQIIDEDTTAFDWDMTTVRLGGARSTSRCFEGLIGEVLIYEGKLGQSDRELVTQYLSDRWDIPEPATMGLLAIGGVLVTCRRKRRGR